jgi:hypothetical protein
MSIVVVLLSIVTNAYASSSVRQADGGCQTPEGIIHLYLLFFKYKTDIY